MRPLCAAALLALAALSLVPLAPTAGAAASPSSAGPGPLRIAEVLPVPDGAQGQREFLELWNPTNLSVALAGWHVRDAPTSTGSFNEFTFASGALAPGGRIVVWSNGTGDARGPSWSSSAGKTVWNDAGDAATLLDPAGAIADWLAYGSTSAAPPPGFEGQAKPPAPGKGLSVAWDGSAWAAGAPTPALAPGQTGAFATATVLNVAPTVAITGLPAAAKPGQVVSVTLTASDANGAADLASWTLLSGGQTVAQGTAPPTAPFTLAAPATTGPWIVEATATDAGGLTARASATVSVRDARLSLAVPDGVLRFPDLRPGDRDVTATGWATLRNDGTDLATPLLDVSPFTSGASQIPVDGNLWVGVTSGNATTFLRYEGPLTALPALVPGASMQVTLRLAEVPTPLAAGSYGTTFAVVAA
jgi:hypothetical protein